MRQRLQHHLTPRWVLLIYIASVMEAVGLSVYFQARLTDPEMASMQALTVDAQGMSSKAAVQPGCTHCLMLAKSRQHAVIRKDYTDRDRSGRERESR